MKILKLINKIYWRLKNPEEYARHIGVKIGNKCHIGIRDWGSEPYLIKIGNNVAITRGVMLHTHGGARVARTIYPDFDVFGRIIVEDNVYIGSGSQLMPGVTIGEGSLIAAGSIVTKSVPAGEVWGGNPARRLCSVEEYIQRNLKYNLDSKGLSPKDKKKLLLSLPQSAFINK